MAAGAVEEVEHGVPGRGVGRVTGGEEYADVRRQLKKDKNFELDLDRAKYWVSKGAKPSDTVASFIKKASRAAAAVA